MTDLLQNVQKVYEKWESRSSVNRGRTRCSSYRNASPRQIFRNEDRSMSQPRYQNNRDYRRPRHSTAKYDALAGFKMAPTVAPLRNPRNFIGTPCATCLPRSRAVVEDKTVYLLGVFNILHIPYFPMQSFNICCFWNLFNGYRSLPSQVISHDSLKCKIIEEAIQEIVNSNDSDDVSEKMTVETLCQRSKALLKDLKSSVSLMCVGTATFFLHHILKRLFSGIFVHKGQMEVLGILSKENIPFIYLPVHRSYFDYILLLYVLHMNSLQTPFIIAPDNFCIPVLGYILRFIGAIFVNYNLLIEKPETDILYDAVVKSHLVRCLEIGNHLQLFIEGSRSITGKPQIPDTNLLSALVNSVSEGSVEDAYIVPVSITFETIEEIHVAKQLGGKSSDSKTSFLSRLHSFWKLMHTRYGNVRVNFNQPFSLKEFLKNYSGIGSSSTVSGAFSSNSYNQKIPRNQVKDLSSHVIYDAINSSSLMSTHLLAFLFVTQYRKGGTQQQLQSSMDWLCGEIVRKKWDLGFSGQSLPVIKRAVELLGKDLISIETIEMEWTSSDLENNNVKVKVYTPVVKLPHVLELQYYANAVVPVFIKESIVVNALYALIDVDICHFHHCDSRFFVSREELIQKASKLNDFLKFEFITVPPCQDVVSIFNDVIDELIEKECLTGTGNELGRFKPYKKSSAYSFDMSSDEEQYDEVRQQLKIDLREESINQLEFLRNILSPYIESYWLAACSLLKLIDEVKEESVFIHEMQMTAQDKLYKGLLAYEESFSSTTLKNSLKLFCDQKIVEYDTVDCIRTIYLSEPYNNFESVNDVIADIEDFRK